jgi:hypothetical protein
MEMYHFRAKDTAESPPLFYFSTFGAFSARDEATCHVLARSGYDVMAMDPLRYLLHASAQGRLSARDLWDDAQNICDQIQARPLILGQPVGAGLALLWASGVESFRGVLALGLAQRAFRPSHIFANDNPHTFFLARQVHKITPRPVAYVRESAHPLGGSRDELAALHQTSGTPRRLEEVERATDALLLDLLDWLKNRAIDS